MDNKKIIQLRRTDKVIMNSQKVRKSPQPEFARRRNRAEINYGTETISECERKGVYDANSWYLEGSGDVNIGPAYPGDNIVTCDT
jgi:hypothetical protein